MRIALIETAIPVVELMNEFRFVNWQQAITVDSDHLMAFMKVLWSCAIFDCAKEP